METYIPGSTELVELKKIERELKLSNRIFAKVENTNPTGSIKDRTVFFMLKAFKDNGTLKEGGTIVEATSGNTGISLAFYQKYFNYKAIIVMPTSASLERRAMIAKYNAELVLVDGGMKECNAEAQEIIDATPNSFIFNQFGSEYNHLAHYQSTGPEIYSQLNDIDYLVAGIGTGGTLSGTGKFLKEKSSKVQVIGVEPSESPLLTKGYANSHLIQGIGANFVPDSYKSNYVDEVIDVEGLESIKKAKLIRELEGIDIGISSGAALLGAIRLIETKKLTNKNIVIIFPDKGDRYSW